MKKTRDGRLILRGAAYRKMRLKLRNLANGKCEQCGHHTENGDAHHVNGRSAGKRDDRIIHPETGERLLRYLCRACHTGKHVPEKVVPAKPTEAEFDRLIGLGL